MAKLKTLLLHPDASLRADLRKKLEKEDFLHVLGESIYGLEALELLENIKYGAVFLACDLSGELSAADFARCVKGRKDNPALIFISENEAGAYTAFELGALDYLLWPPNKKRWATTLEKLQNFKNKFREVPEPLLWEEPEAGGEATAEETVRLPLNEEEQEVFLTALKNAWEFSRSQTPEIEKLAVSQDGKTILIPYTRIIFVEAYEDYSYVHTNEQKFLTSHRLKNLEERLAPHRFFRVHRKYLVNLDMVTEIASLPGSNFMLRTAGKTRIELPISRRRIAKLKQILGF